MQWRLYFTFLPHNHDHISWQNAAINTWSNFKVVASWTGHEHSKLSINSFDHDSADFFFRILSMRHVWRALSTKWATQSATHRHASYPQHMRSNLTESLTAPEKFEKADFSFSCRRKAFWQTKIFENEGVTKIIHDFPDRVFLKHNSIIPMTGQVEFLNSLGVVCIEAWSLNSILNFSSAGLKIA